MLQWAERQIASASYRRKWASVSWKELVKNAKIILFYLFYFIILPLTMNYKQNKNDNK